MSGFEIGIIRTSVGQLTGSATQSVAGDGIGRAAGGAGRRALRGRRGGRVPVPGVAQARAAGAHPADAAGRAAGDEGVVRDGARHDGPGAHGREAADVAPATTTAPAPMEQP